MAKKGGKKGGKKSGTSSEGSSKKGKKGKKKAEKTDSQIFLEQLTEAVRAKLKEEIWDIEDEERKKSKKKMSKAEKKKLQAKRNEELKVAVEQERIRLQEEERIRLEEERKRALEKDSRDAAEQAIRVDQLKHSCHIIRKLQQLWLKKEKKNYLDAEWEQYLKCDGLPDPCNIAEMNTYLHLWDKVKENTLEDLALQKTDEVLELLDTLDIFLDCQSVSNSKKADWMHIRNLFRDYQQFNLDCLAYRLLRDIESNLERLDIPTARKVVAHPNNVFILVVWALIQLPIPLPNPKRTVEHISTLEYPELYELEVTFPSSVDIWAKCVRAMVVKYDHLSHKCSSYEAPQVAQDKLYLDKVTHAEYDEKVRIKKNVRSQIRAERQSEARRLNSIAQNTEKSEDIEAARRAEKTLNDFIKVDDSQIYLLKEDEEYAEMRNQLIIEVPEEIINLRQYRVIGGVFFIDLYFQPPQPVEMVLSDVTLSTLTLPKASESVPFNFTFTPPVPPEPGVVRQPEDIEAEMKYVEEQYDQMVNISLFLPSHVLWLEPPKVVQWDSEKLHWTVADVHDAKYNEEKQSMQFRLAKLAPFSFAVLRYSCMPYQAWELKPLQGGKVLLTITSPILIIEFTVRGSELCLSSLQNAPSKALDHLVNVWTTLPRLRRRLRRGGLELFPAADAALYLEPGAVADKHQPLETHLYYQMAQTALHYNYQWSRWNLQAGRRGVVMQVREYSTQERVKQPTFQMALINPMRATFVECTEVSSAFSEEPAKKMRFYADLYHLLLGVGTHSMKCKLEKVPPDLINTVAQLLIATRILSMC